MGALDMTENQEYYILLVLPCVLGMAFAARQLQYVWTIKMAGPEEEQSFLSPGNAKSTIDKMMKIATAISDGATQFLVVQYVWISVFVLLFSGVIYAFFAFSLNRPAQGLATVVAFLIGAITSMGSGYVGMKTAVMCNVRTAQQCWARGLDAGFQVALRGGAIMGFALVAMGVLALLFTLWLFTVWGWAGEDKLILFEALAGFGLGGSSVALFGRVGGGIYTKAADVGADLSGKNEYGMDEDDPRNPACIADNVGDNVGDVAGMGADLFGSFAESTCAALILVAKSIGVPAGLGSAFIGLYYPVLISTVGIVVGVLTLVMTLCSRVDTIEKIEGRLRAILILSTVLYSALISLVTYALVPATFALDASGHMHGIDALLIPVNLGLWSGLFIGLLTEYYTSHSYTPVREIAESQQVAAATGIIYGLAVGYLSCVGPVFLIAFSVLIAHNKCGMLGVALAALGMLSTMSVGLTIDVYGPISDNAGGIAEMSELGSGVRELTDALDAAGNTTAAIGKGFAIGSAALVSLALYGAFKETVGIVTIDISTPLVWSGLLVGAMLPYWFSAMTMKSVGVAAQDMVKECMRQFPNIVNGSAQPDYKTCIKISTEASLKEMVPPGILVISAPLITGLLFGKDCVAGLLAGILVSGVQLAISMSNTGGAWDNAKKYIEKGGLGPDHSKGSATHKNAVTGDTVGDPLKDTSGPSLNILVKLTAIISLVFAPVFKDTFLLRAWFEDTNGNAVGAIEVNGATAIAAHSAEAKMQVHSRHLLENPAGSIAMGSGPIRTF